MKKYLFLLLLLCLPFVSAQELFDYQSLVLDTSISNTLNLEGGSVSSAEITLFWFPRDDYRQSVKSLDTIPTAKVDENLVFSFNNPTSRTLKVEAKSVVETSARSKKVYQQTVFPITNLDPALSKYVQPQGIIDINDDIRELAVELSSGKEDQYEVVFAFADWVEQNIEYNLSTLTADAAQKSSWVLDNGYGVCDELTSLFISLNRAVGIPARFVSGVSYTNLDVFDDNWGPHGWAEVYFPDIGWVPFDVTYNQFGWVDPTHVKLQVSVDAEDKSVGYTARGRDFEMVSQPIDIDVNILEKGRLSDKHVSLDVKVSKDVANFGSHNLVVVELSNDNNYYVSVALQLGRTENVENLDSNKRNILLGPGESEKTYFIVKVAEDLDNDYIYTFPIKVFAGTADASTSFKSKINADSFDYNYFKRQVPVEEDYNPVSISCDRDELEVMVGDKVLVNCNFTNTDDKTLRWTNMCLADSCYNKHLEPGDIYEGVFEKNFSTPGTQTLAVRAKNEYFVSTNYIVAQVEDNPSLSFDSINSPNSISFKESATMEFVVRKDSFTDPKNIEVFLKSDVLSEKWVLEDFGSEENFRVNIPGKILKPGENIITLQARFEDEEGNGYTVEKDLIITLEDVSLSQRITIFFNRIGLKLQKFL